MHTRACKAEDFPAVFLFVNAACEADHTRRQLEPAFRQDYFSGPDGAPTERGIVAVTPDATIAGFIYWEDRFDTDGDDSLYGMAVQVWVDPNWRGQGVGSALLEAVDQFAQRSGRNTVRITIRTYADVPGAVQLLEHFGYREARRYYKMTVDLRGQHFNTKPVESVVLRPFSPEHLTQLVAADNAIFSEHWGAHTISVEAWHHRMIDQRPHDPALWVIAWADHQIVGECLAHASLHDGPHDGWVSIVGIRKAWRGRGLGKLLLATGLRGLQSAGFETASLHVDAQNESAFKLYGSVGMAIARTHLYYRKTLKVR
jgi:mycothiol synthase